MKLLFGGTRAVLLLGAKAYKIAMLRPDKVVLKLCEMAVIKTEFDRLYTKHKHQKLRILLRIIFSGWWANRAEWRYWKQTYDARCVPTLALWGWGFILVQPRVEAVSASEVLATGLETLWHEDEEFSRSDQYGRGSDGTIRIVDYASFAI